MWLEMGLVGDWFCRMSIPVLDFGRIRYLRLLRSMVVVGRFVSGGRLRSRRRFCHGRNLIDEEDSLSAFHSGFLIALAPVSA